MQKLLLSLLLAPCAALASEPGISRVYDFMPAPGQFVNQLPSAGDAPTRQSAIDAAQAALTSGSMISLGAYGGYVVFGFDHPVANVKDAYDFKVKGNAFAASSEAGIVMVSVDANGNGLPDDEWYELAGSAYDAEGSRHGYTVTYTRPADDTAADGYAWASNDPDNAQGVVARNTFHKQSYWPAWVQDETLTFTGTRLPMYAYKEGNTWKLPAFEFGYADNLPNADDPGLKIDWAVNADGTPVTLDHIDFVKVYTGSQQCVGMIGETSTEVAGAEDLHVDAAYVQPELYVGTFDNLPLPGPDTWWNHGECPEDEFLVDSEFTTGSFSLNNSYMPDYDSWMFFAYSNVATSEFDYSEYATHQYRSAAGGAHSGANFGVLFGDANMGISKITLLGDADKAVPGVYLCNAAWAADAIANGDHMGGDAYGAGDWFKLTVTGKKADGGDAPGAAEVYLADYRSDDPAQWSRMDQWTWVDLSGIGELHELRFAFDSSQKNAWGITTPAYVCLDDLGAANPDASTIISGNQAAQEAYSVDGLDVTAPEGSSLFDLSGRLVARGSGMRAPAAGIYILRTGTSAIKIALR